MLVYLIEDNKVDSLIGCAVIKKTLPAVTIEIFTDGFPAIEAIECAKHAENDRIPDLLFLDMAMPGMDGFGFLERYVSLLPSFKTKSPLLYILTTSLSSLKVEKAKSYPFVQDVLFKGFSIKVFATILDKHFPHLTYNKPAEKILDIKPGLTLENWVSEYKRLESKYNILQDKQSLEARGLLDHMEAVWSIIQDTNSKKEFSKD